MFGHITSIIVNKNNVFSVKIQHENYTEANKINVNNSACTLPRHIHILKKSTSNRFSAMILNF